MGVVEGQLEHRRQDDQQGEHYYRPVAAPPPRGQPDPVVVAVPMLGGVGMMGLINLLLGLFPVFPGWGYKCNGTRYQATFCPRHD